MEKSNFVSDETDYFREVKRRSPFYNELLGDFLMDQHHKQVKAILDDGEFSDEVSVLKKLFYMIINTNATLSFYLNFFTFYRRTLIRFACQFHGKEILDLILSDSTKQISSHLHLMHLHTEKNIHN